MAKEIELKARVTDGHAVEAALHALGSDLGESVEQADTIYLPQGMSYGALVPGTSVVRIRVVRGQATLTLKRRLQGKGELQKIEHEVAVDSAHETEKILNNLGYVVSLCILKRRRQGMLSHVQVCLDDVDGLGLFLELEILLEDGSSDDAEAELERTLEKLGIDASAIVREGYDTLLYKQATTS